MERMRITILVDHYPALSETFVLNEIEALGRIGHDIHVEAAKWAASPAEPAPNVSVDCLDDDSLPRRLAALVWLISRHPLRAAADLVARRRWSREEVVRPLRVIAPVARRVARRRTQHLHAHFAAGVALDAMRMGRLLGLPYSVTAHAYDIYRQPRNLREKLAQALIATGECEYSVKDLRQIAAPRSEHIHVVKMGVDADRFKRRTPHPPEKAIVAVGRLVEKKGFGYLLDAASQLASEGAVERVVIVGDGPLRDELHLRATELGLANVVEWRGAQPAQGVRAALERAAVVAIPAVPTANGDRDVLPLIAGEALAMEIPVVASDFVGLPEVIREPWGRLVPPADADALAEALATLLAMSATERAVIGRAGRDFVIRTRDLQAEARRLTQLIANAQRPR
jgi:colanic acid/amylovoran biosynthesis glycosyltransferase